MFLLACGLSLQPSLLRAIFNVDPDEVRSLILKKEDVNVQVSLATQRFQMSTLITSLCKRPPSMINVCIKAATRAEVGTVYN